MYTVILFTKERVHLNVFLESMITKGKAINKPSIRRLVAFLLEV